MKKLLFALVCVGCSLALFGQAGLSTDKEKEAMRWVQEQLDKANNPEILEGYDGNGFFKKDSVRIVGYIKGYDRSLGFASGVLYNNNLFTREEVPATIRIQEDGIFEVSYQVSHPQVSFLDINDELVKIYAEPGHTLGLLLDWEDALQHPRYLGELAPFNHDFFGVEINKPDYGRLDGMRKKTAPNDFKETFINEWEAESVRIGSLLVQKKTEDKLSALVRSEVDIAYAIYIFDYASSRGYYREQDTANAVLKLPLPDDYYDFVYSLDLNDQSHIATSMFSTFINRYEMAPPFRVVDYRDSVLIQPFSEVKSSLVNDIALARKVAANFAYYSKLGGTPVPLQSDISHPFLLENLESYVQYLLARKDGYALPNTYAAGVFKKIIEQHKGKILIVDFWAEWCAPCRAGIEANLADREKYADSPDFAFLFVTDGSTGEDFYKTYTAEQKMAHSYKVSNDEYMALRELFGFDGIPRYVLVAADGKILDDNFSSYNWKGEFTTRFPDQFKLEDFFPVVYQ